MQSTGFPNQPSPTLQHQFSTHSSGGQSIAPKNKHRRKQLGTQREPGPQSCDRTCFPCRPSVQTSSRRRESGEESYNNQARSWACPAILRGSLSPRVSGAEPAGSDSWLCKLSPSMLCTNGGHIPLATTPNRNPARPLCHPQRPKFPEWFGLVGHRV